MNPDKAGVGIFQVPVADSWTSNKHLVEPVAPRGPPHPSWSTSTTALNPIKVRMRKQNALAVPLVPSNDRVEERQHVLGADPGVKQWVCYFDPKAVALEDWPSRDAAYFDPRWGTEGAGEDLTAAASKVGDAKKRGL